MLKAVKEEIFHGSDGSEDLPEWVKSWKSDCIEELRRRLKRDIPIYQTYFELSNLICQQLGYDEKFQNMVDFLVNETMKRKVIQEII